MLSWIVEKAIPILVMVSFGIEFCYWIVGRGFGGDDRCGRMMSERERIQERARGLGIQFKWVGDSFSDIAEI